MYGLRPRERRLSLVFLHSSHREPEETRCGQPEVEHTFHMLALHKVLRVGVEPTMWMGCTLPLMTGIQRIMEALAGLIRPLVSVLSRALP